MKKRLLFLVVLMLSTITIIAQNVPNYVPSNGLVGWWPFNGNANDESGNGNHGTENGATLTSDRNGKENSAYSFQDNDITQSISTNYKGVLGKNSRTISFWFLQEVISNVDQQILLGYGDFILGGQFIATTLNGKIGVDILNASRHFATIPLYKWHHALYVYNGGNSIDDVKLYFNGILQTDYSLSYGNEELNTQLGVNFSINNGSIKYQKFIGKIDDIAFYNRALTQEEITALYTGNPPCTNPTASITPQGDTTFCQGGFVNLNATSGANYTYEWYNNGQVITDATSISYQATSTGNFTVKISDGACNTTSSPVSVLVNQIPSNLVNASGNTTFCAGSNVTLYALGTGTYLWSNGATSQSINVVQSGDYSVIVSNNGCTSTSTNTKVTVNPTPTASITPQGNTTFCQGGFVNLVASGGTNYQWNTSSQNATINVNQGGTYSVNVFNQFNCQASASQVVTVNSNPTVTLSALNNVVYKTSAPVQLVGNPSGGTYVGNGVQGSVFTPSNASLGNKTITYNYTSPQGCSGSASRSTIVVDTVGNVCSVTKYDTVKVIKTVNDTVSILKIKIKLTTGVKVNQITDISVYPNPTSDILVIESSDIQALGGYRYRILDVLGKEVYNALVISSKTEISLKTLGAKGTYILHIVDANNVSIHDTKIVLE
jgi:hypothetical protein